MPTLLKKKKAGVTHKDGTRAVPNMNKGAIGKSNEGARVMDAEDHRLGKGRLAHELRGSTSGYDRPGGHNVGSLVKKKKAAIGGKFGDPIKRAQRKAKRKMRKEQGSLAFGPTRKTKRQQKRGLRQVRKQQLR